MNKQHSVSSEQHSVGDEVNTAFGLADSQDLRVDPL